MIAGELGGLQGPGVTYIPIIVAHATVARDSRLAVPWPTDYNALAYVLAGSGSVGTEAVPVEVGNLAVFGRDD